MSQAEVERFVSDVKSNEALLKELSEGVIGLDELVSRARAKGYDFDTEDAKVFARSQAYGEISDDQLDMVAGGQGTAIEGADQPTAAVVAATVDTTITIVALINAFVTGTQQQ